jgi:hypothetical protein
MRFLPQGVPVEYEMTDIKKALIESWCTSPGQRALLKWLDIKYDYFANNGAFAASIRFGLEDCKN